MSAVGFVALSVGVVLLIFGVLWPAVDRRIRHEEATSAAERPRQRLSLGTVLLALVVFMLSIVGVLGPIVTFGYVREVLSFPTE